MLTKVRNVQMSKGLLLRVTQQTMNKASKLETKNTYDLQRTTLFHNRYNLCPGPLCALHHFKNFAIIRGSISVYNNRRIINKCSLLCYLCAKNWIDRIQIDLLLTKINFLILINGDNYILFCFRI